MFKIVACPVDKREVGELAREIGGFYI